MKTNFSFERIVLLLQADLIEFRKSMLINMGVFFLVWIVLLWLVTSKNAEMQNFCFYLGTYITLLMFCQHAGRKLHHTKSTFLTLPAGNLEKYVSLLIESVIYFTGFQFVFWAGLMLWKVFYPEMPIPSLGIYYYLVAKTSFLFSISIFFLSYMSFRKHAFLIVLGLSSIYIILNIWILLFLGIKVFMKDPGLDSDIDSFNRMVEIMRNNIVLIFSIATLVIMYVAFLKLKEKQLR